jgi:uncharacterized membrane protein required for colicin V production
VIIDAAIALIVLFFVFLGFKNGFIRTVFHTLGWVAAIAAAAILHKSAESFLKERTTIYEHMYDRIEDLITSFTGKIPDIKIDGASAVENLSGIGDIPGALNDAMQGATEKATAVATTQATDILFSIVVFLILIFIVKFVFFIITLLFSKKYRKKGIVGGLDGFAGAVLGIVQAALLVFALLALLLPASYMINQDAYDWVIHAMDRSIFSQYLYENNPLLHSL